MRMSATVYGHTERIMIAEAEKLVRAFFGDGDLICTVQRVEPYQNAAAGTVLLYEGTVLGERLSQRGHYAPVIPGGWWRVS